MTGGTHQTRTPRNPARLSDTKFTTAFDTVLASDGIRVILTPIRTPVANAHAKRFVHTTRHETLDRIPITNKRHLQRVVADYLEHHNAERPHRQLGLESPDPPPRHTDGPVKRRDRLGGLIHHYERSAA